MSVETQTSRYSYTGDGTTTIFSFPSFFLANGDLSVWVDATLKTLTTHYTVAGALQSGGGAVTFLTAPGASTTVVLANDPGLLQEEDYDYGGDLPASTIERGLDRVTLLCQSLSDKIKRTCRVGVAFDEIAEPTVAERTSKVWGFDSSGDPALVDAPTISTSVDVTVTNAASLSAVDTSSMSNNDVGIMLGYYTAGDDGGGIYWLDTSGNLGASAENGGTIIAATGGTNNYWRLLNDCFYSVKQFGAKGDGSTDDATAIQAALDAAIDGTVVYFPDGTYWIDAKLILDTDGVTLRGSRGAWIKNDTTQDLSYLEVGSSTTRIERVLIDGLGIREQHQTPTSDNFPALQLRYCKDSHVRNCQFTGCYTAVRIGHETAGGTSETLSSTRCSIMGCDILESKKFSVELMGCTECWVSENNIQTAVGTSRMVRLAGDAGDLGGTVPRNMRCRVHDNHIEGQQIGVDVQMGVYDAIIKGNYIYGHTGTTTSGVQFHGTAGLSILNNVIRGWDYGIYGWDNSGLDAGTARAADTVIRGNVFHNGVNLTQRGAYLRWLNGFIFENNTMWGTGEGYSDTAYFMRMNKCDGVCIIRGNHFESTYADMGGIIGTANETTAVFKLVENTFEANILPFPAWASATAYVIGDKVLEAGSKYSCLENHTSGTSFAADLAADKWLLVFNETIGIITDGSVYSDQRSMTWTSGAITDGGTAGKVESVAAINFAIDDLPYTKAATDDLWDLTGVSTDADEFMKVLLCLDAAGAATIIEGTIASATGAGQADALVPEPLHGTVPVGIIEIGASYSGGSLSGFTMYDIVGAY